MTIHHDKLAYGKLTSASEDLTDEQLLNMLKELSEESETAQEENDKIKTP